MKKKILLICSIICIAFGAMSQNTINTPAHAVIVTPITITLNNSGLEFGNIAVSNPLLGGIVTLTPASPTVVTPTTGISLMSTGATREAASFTVSGVMNYAYSITPMSNSILTVGTPGSGPNTMVLSGITAKTNSTGLSTGGMLSGTGSDIFYVGGTLTVTMMQTPGIYTGTFPVTVNYN